MDVEFLPPLREKMKFKTGRTSYADLAEFRLLNPGLTKKLEVKEQLTSEHLILGAWLLYKELLRGKVAVGQMPYFMAPMAVHTFLTADQEDLEQVEQKKIAGQILEGRFRRHGLLGVPLYAGEHWTLLVFRRSKDATQIRF